MYFNFNLLPLQLGSSCCNTDAFNDGNTPIAEITPILCLNSKALGNYNVGCYICPKAVISIVKTFTIYLFINVITHLQICIQDSVNMLFLAVEMVVRENQKILHG